MFLSSIARPAVAPQLAFVVLNGFMLVAGTASPAREHSPDVRIAIPVQSVLPAWLDITYQEIPVHSAVLLMDAGSVHPRQFARTAQQATSFQGIPV